MEQKVLLLTLEEKSNEEIAQELGIAVSTVKSHKAKRLRSTKGKTTILKNIVTFTFLIFNNISFSSKKITFCLHPNLNERVSYMKIGDKNEETN